MDVDDKSISMQQDDHDDAFYDAVEDQGDGDDFQMRFGRPGGFRGGRGGPPPNWGPPSGPPRFRGRGYGPTGPPMRGGRGVPPFFRGRGGRPPFGPNGPNGPASGPPNFDGPGWGPMGPPGMMGPGGPNGPGGPPFGPPGMMGGPMGMGPPSQMMGPNNGGHFGPPGMGPPPPMMPELWVETKSEDGKYYFYNACSRETTWTKPEGLNVKIISQSEIEAMNHNQMNPGTMIDPQGMPNQPKECKNGETSPTEASGNPGVGSNSVQDISDDMQGNPPPNMPMNIMGPNGPMAMGPNGAMGLVPGGPKVGPNASGVVPPLGPGPFGGMPPNFGPPPFGMPPPGNWPGLAPGQWPGGAPPPFMSKPPSAIGAPVVAAVKDVSLSNFDPVLVAKAAEWTEHKAPDGRSYYYHAKNAESVWEKPQALKDLDAAKLIQQNAPVVSLAPQAATKPAVAINQVVKSPKETVQTNANGKTCESENQPASTNEVSTEKSAAAPVKKIEEEKKPVAKLQDKSKPVSSTPISGTPWCVVWTGDGRVFFYNPSSRTSVWERPEELSGRADVDKAVSNPPNVIGNSASNSGNTQQNDDSKQQPVKREQTDSDDSDSPQNKKTKKDEGSSVLAAAMDKKQIDIGKEAAIEAEVRAARERAVVPLETRVKSFKEMLQEKEVSAFSTWEKELHKIVFDPRYLLLTSKERKQVFDRYVKDRAEEERREKRFKLKQRKDEFRALMEQAHLHGKSSFSDFAAKYSKDERFKNIEKMRERESLFNEYILDIRKKEKEDKQQKREQIKKEFFALLREHKEIDRHSRWGDVKKKLENDPRYKCIDSSSNREDWFRDYCRILKDERRKEKENKEKDKERKEKERKERKESSSSKSDTKKESSKKEAQSTSETGTASEQHSEGETTKRERTDSNTSAVDEEDEKQKEREKQARAEQSIREREKEVQRTLATHMRDRDKEREHHKRDEAVQHFTALLSDLVRNGETTWREAKRQLRKDHRWDLADLLDREEKERLFESHMEQLTKKKRDKFREMLDELNQVTLTSTWKDVKKLIKDDPRYSKFSSSEKCEREFRDYMKDKLGFAKIALRELLQETKLITHKSLATVKENPQHLTEIENLLKMDKRYLVLEHVVTERTHIIMSYLEELDKRGPPPPPTASEPTRRLK